MNSILQQISNSFNLKKSRDTLKNQDLSGVFKQNKKSNTFKQKQNKNQGSLYLSSWKSQQQVLMKKKGLSMSLAKNSNLSNNDELSRNQQQKNQNNNYSSIPLSNFLTKDSNPSSSLLKSDVYLNYHLINNTKKENSKNQEKQQIDLNKRQKLISLGSLQKKKRKSISQKSNKLISKFTLQPSSYNQIKNNLNNMTIHDNSLCSFKSGLLSISSVNFNNQTKNNSYLKEINHNQSSKQVFHLSNSNYNQKCETANNCLNYNSHKSLSRKSLPFFENSKMVKVCDDVCYYRIQINEPKQIKQKNQGKSMLLQKEQKSLPKELAMMSPIQQNDKQNEEKQKSFFSKTDIMLKKKLANSKIKLDNDLSLVPDYHLKRELKEVDMNINKLDSLLPESISKITNERIQKQPFLIKKLKNNYKASSFQIEKLLQIQNKLESLIEKIKH